MAFDVNSNINTQLEDAIINTYFECELMGLREKLTKLVKADSPKKEPINPRA